MSNQLQKVMCVSLAALAAVCLPATAAVRNKANNQDNLNLGSSWLGGAPTSWDIAQWANTVTGTNATLLGGDLSWWGIKIVNPGGAVSIAGTNTLTLGGGGVDMTLATQNLTLGCGLTLLANAGQDWNVANGMTLAITGSVLRSTGCAVAVKGFGTVSVSSFSNGVTDIIAPWATFGTGTSAMYATVSGANIAGYSGTPAATAAEVTDTTGALNYDVAAVGTLGAGASFNTLRYTGAAGTAAGAFQANGLLNAGTGALTLSGNAIIGPDKELVLISPDTTRTLTLNGAIGDNAGGASGVTKAGAGIVKLYSDNSYSGETFVGQGSLDIDHSNSLGSASAGTTIYTGAQLALSGGITLAEPLTLNGHGIAYRGVLWNLSGVNTVVGTIIVGSNDTRVGASSGSTLILAGGVTRNGSATGDFLVLNYDVLITNAPVNMGVGGIMTVGSGNVLAATNNTYSYLNAGWRTVLRTDVAGALCPSGTLEMGSFSPTYDVSRNGTVNLNGFSQTVGGLLTPALAMGTTNAQYRILTSAAAATLTVNQSANSTYDGRLTGALSLTKTGAGTLTLSGTNNTCTGVMTVSAGTLKISANNALSSGGSVALAGGTLDVSSCTNAAVSLSLTANSTLALGTNGQAAFTAQTVGVWSGQLTLTGTLGLTSLRFQPALSADQLSRIRYNGLPVMQNSNGYIRLITGTLIRVM